MGDRDDFESYANEKPSRHGADGPPGPRGSQEFESWRDDMINRIVAEAKLLDEHRLNRLISKLSSTTPDAKPAA